MSTSRGSAPTSRSAITPGPENGSPGHPRRRYCARLQQYPDGDPGLRRIVPIQSCTREQRVAQPAADPHCERTCEASGATDPRFQSPECTATSTGVCTAYFGGNAAAAARVAALDD